MNRALYIRLRPEEFEALGKMAARDRRDLHDQAAFLVSQALARYQIDLDFERSLPPMADEPIEGAA